MLRVIGVIFWLVVAVWGTLVFLTASNGWTWRGQSDLPANYRLSDSDWQDVAPGSPRILYQGRYLRRPVSPKQRFTVADLAPAPEIDVPANFQPWLVALDKQPAAASINAGRTVSIWDKSKPAPVAARVPVAALLCPDAAARPAACRAVLLLDKSQQTALAAVDPNSLTLLPAPGK